MSFAQQEPDVAWEVRPKVTAGTDLISRTRIQVWGELQDGLNFSYNRWRTGGLLTYRLKPILKLHLRDIDEDRNHYLVFGGGYEYLHTVQNGSTKNENRISGEFTPQILLAGLFFTDRNKNEFRWVNGAYDFRYRNRLVISHRFEKQMFRFTPYASGELYYDRNHHSWNQSQYGGGVQFPHKNLLMLDLYVLHQNCTTCSQNPVNMLGTTLNFYFDNVR
jgi:hypothetical protein